MKRLKEAEAAKSKAAPEDSAGLNAMRAALAACDDVAINARFHGRRPCTPSQSTGAPS